MTDPHNEEARRRMWLGAAAYVVMVAIVVALYVAAMIHSQ